MEEQFNPWLLAGVLVAVSLIAWALAYRPRRTRESITSAPRTKEETGYQQAKVLKVIDGDTVIVLSLGKRIRVRLDSIDCPEDGQPWGDIAKYGLIKLIGGREIKLEVHGADLHGRTVATAFVEDRTMRKLINVNERMVTLGHAWVMRRYYDHLPVERKTQLNRLERWARFKKVGLWKTPNPVPPWKWRQGYADPE